MGELKKWREQNWVRIGIDGSIKGPCGTSKDKKRPDRCLQWLKRRASLSLKERLQLARKKLAEQKENSSSQTHQKQE